MTEPNDRENVRERMAELGRASGRARRQRKKERRSLLDVWKSRGDPEQLFDGLAQSAAGNVALARILEKGGAFEPPEDAAKPAAAALGGSPVGFIDIIRIAVETGQERILLGFALTEEQRAQVLATAEDEGSSASGSRARAAATDARASASTSDDEGGATAKDDPHQEIDRSPIFSGNEESVVPWARPPDIYADAATQAVHRQRVKRGLPTGHPFDVYRDAGDRL